MLCINSSFRVSFISLDLKHNTLPTTRTISDQGKPLYNIFYGRKNRKRDKKRDNKRTDIYWKTLYDRDWRVAQYRPRQRLKY